MICIIEKYLLLIIDNHFKLILLTSTAVDHLCQQWSPTPRQGSPTGNNNGKSS